jgi:hypothetical protein
MRAGRIVAFATALALGTFACSKEPDVEKVAVGTDVQLTRQDGGVVQGKLTAKDEKSVKVSSGRTTRTVPKDQIADVKVIPPSSGAGTTKAPELPPVAKFREMTVPNGTKLELELETDLSTKTAKVEDPVEARLTQAVTIDGREVLPVGTRVHGTVAAVAPAGKVKGVASITLRFSRLTARDENYNIAADYSLTAPSEKKKDAAKIGIGAAAGAVIGAIAGGGKGAAIGAAIGGGAGTGYVLMKAGEDITIAKGAPISVSLDRDVDIRIPIR